MSKDKLIPTLRFPEFVNDGEWDDKRIGEFAPLQRGFDLPVDDIVDGDYPVVFSNGILKYHNEYKVKAPGVVTGRSGTIGKVTYVKEDFWPHNTSLWVTDFFGNFPLFVFYYFLFIRLEQFGTGSGVPTLNRNDVHRHNILIPNSIQEQQKIASCLSSLDELIVAHNDKLVALKDHKKGLMQNLFPQEGETLPKYRFSEFYQDEEWVVKRLGDIADVSKLAGYEFTKHIKYESKGKIIALRGLNIKNNSLDLREVKYIDNSELSMLERSKLYVDDLMFTYIGTIGEVALIDENDRYYLAPNVSRIRANKEIIYPQFLLQRFNVPQFKSIEIAKFISSSSQPALTMGNIRKFELNIPSLKEQQKIASCLSSLDELITAQAKKIEQLQLHKKGLMQGLFPKSIMN